MSGWTRLYAIGAGFPPFESKACQTKDQLTNMLMIILSQSRFWHDVTLSIPPIGKCTRPSSLYDGGFGGQPVLVRGKSTLTEFKFAIGRTLNTFVEELLGVIVKFIRPECEWFVRNDTYALWLSTTERQYVAPPGGLDTNPKPIYNAILVVEGGMNAFSTLWSAAQKQLLPTQQLLFLNWVFNQVITGQPWAMGCTPTIPNVTEFTGCLLPQSVAWTQQEHAAHRAAILLTHFGGKGAA